MLFFSMHQDRVMKRAKELNNIGSIVPGKLHKGVDSVFT